MKSSSILSAVRTPIGRFGGKLSHLTAAELAAIAIKEALTRAGVSPEQVDLMRKAGLDPAPPKRWPGSNRLKCVGFQGYRKLFGPPAPPVRPG